MSGFYNELVVNDLNCQTLQAIDGIETPVLKVGGISFSGLDLSGGITSTYANDTFLKKADATVLNDITGGTSISLSKNLITPSASISNLTAPTITSSMSSTNSNSVPNISWCQNAFPSKTTVYIKSEIDTLLSSKLDTGSFSNFITTNSTALSTKANISDIFTKTEVNNLLTDKVSSSSFSSYQSNVTTALNTKMDVGNTYTRSAIDNLIVGKVDQVSYVSGLAGKVDSTVFSSFQTSNTSALAGKVNTSDLATSLSGKADLSVTNTLSSSKLDKTVYDTYVSAQGSTITGINNTLSQKADTNAVYSKAFIDNALTGKLDTSTFSTYQGTVSSSLSSKADIANTYTSSQTDALLNAKANSSSVYSTSQTYSKSEADTNFATSAGSGLTKTGNVFSVNASQNQVTSVGTLGSLNVTGSLTAGVVTAPSGIFNSSLNAAGGILVGSASSLPSINGGTALMQIKSATSFDASAMLCLTNGSNDYGRTQIVMTGRYQGTNDDFGLPNSRSAILFNRNVASGTGVNVGLMGSSQFALQHNMSTNQLGIVASGLATSGIAAFFVDNSGYVSCNSTTDAVSATTGSLLCGGGVGVAKSIFIGGATDADFANISSSVSALTVSGGLSVRKYSVFNNNIYVKGGIYPVGSDGGVKGCFFLMGTGNETVPSFLSNATGTTNGCYDFWNSNGLVKTLALRPDVSTFSGKITASNYSTGTVSSASTQSGVTMTKTKDEVNWTKTGRIVQVHVNLVLSSISGTANGDLYFQLPVAPSFSGVMDSQMYINKNGTQLTNMRLTFTSGVLLISLSQWNGSIYVSTTPNGSDNWNILFTYATTN